MSKKIPSAKERIKMGNANLLNEELRLGKVLPTLEDSDGVTQQQLNEAIEEITVTPDTKLLMIDNTRTDSYIEDGSSLKPFKTIAAAIAKAVANGDGDSRPYSFILCSGSYPETITLNGTGLFSVSFIALGRVAVINPSAGSALVSDTSNSDLQGLVFRNVEFGKPISLVGDGTANQFKTVEFKDCSFSGDATFSASALNNLAFWDIYAENTVSLSNVNFLYIGGGQIQGAFSMTMDSALTQPANGVIGGAIIFSLISNAVSLTVGGSAVYNPAFHSSRVGLTSGVYSNPAGCNLSLYNTTFRGTWTNNGVMVLHNSYTNNAVAGTKPIITGNRSEQTSYIPGDTFDWDGADPSDVKEALDRIAAEVATLKGSGIS